ncbi:MAG: hypothetical protein QM757_28080 [Paludibaculum sp.]
MVAPDVIGEDDDRGGVDLFVGIAEIAAQGGFDAEDAEEVVGDGGAFELDGVAVAGVQDAAVTVERRGHEGDGVERFEGLEVAEFGVGEFDEGDSGDLVLLPDDLDCVLIGEGQRLQEDRLDKREHGDAHADAEGQDGDGEQIGRAVAAEGAQGERCVAEGGFQGLQRGGLVDVFVDEGRIAEAAAGEAFSGFGGVAGVETFLLELGEVIGEFGVEAAVVAETVEEAREHGG